MWWFGIGSRKTTKKHSCSPSQLIGTKAQLSWVVEDIFSILSPICVANEITKAKLSKLIMVGSRRMVKKYSCNRPQLIGTKAQLSWVVKYIFSILSPICVAHEITKVKLSKLIMVWASMLPRLGYEEPTQVRIRVSNPPKLIFYIKYSVKQLNRHTRLTPTPMSCRMDTGTLARVKGWGNIDGPNKLTSLL